MRNRKPSLGCCGYDRLEVKPPTTRPLTSIPAKVPKEWKSEGPMVTRPFNAMGASRPFPIVNLDA